MKSKRRRSGATSEPRWSLSDVGAKHLAQRRVQHVRGRMVAGRVHAPFAVHGGRHRLAKLCGATDYLALVDYEAGYGRLRILHLDEPAGSFYEAGVAGLATALGVEGRLAQDDLHLLALVRLVHRDTVHQQGHHDRRSGGGLVAQEAGAGDA